MISRDIMSIYGLISAKAFPFIYMHISISIYKGVDLCTSLCILQIQFAYNLAYLPTSVACCLEWV